MLKVNFSVKDKQIYNDGAKHVIVPTSDGELTILSGHTALISVIKSGELKIMNTHGKVYKFAITRGVLQVGPAKESIESPNTKVILICDDAIDSESIDIAAEEAAIARAREVATNGEVFEDISGLISPLERELNRIRIARRR